MVFKVSLGYVFLISLALNYLYGQHLIVNDYGGENTSFFLDKHEETSLVKIVNKNEHKNAGLDITDLLNLMYLDTLIIENPHGDIRFANGLLKHYSSKKHLIIRAEGNVYFSSHLEQITSSNIEIYSNANVYIEGAGYKNASGVLKINSKNLYISNGGIQQGDGMFLACIMDTLDISGLGIIGGNTELIIEAGHLKLKDSGIASNQLVDISNGIDFHIAGNGINTSTLHLSCESLFLYETGIKTKNGQSNINANSIHINGNGLNSTDSYISLANFDILMIKGTGISISTSQLQLINGIDTYINDNGITASDSEVKMIGIENLEINDSGILMKNSSLSIKSNGLMNINGEGIFSDNKSIEISANEINVATKHTGGSGIRSIHGDININFEEQISVSSNGISSLDGTINLDGIGDISVKNGGIFTTDSNIHVRSKKGHITLDGYNLNSAHNSVSKGGILDTFKIDQSRLTLHTEPVVGAGNVVIKTN